MKTIKKIVIMLMILTSLSYSALASWWNPFSWKVFQRQNVEILQNNKETFTSSTQEESTNKNNIPTNLIQNREEKIIKNITNNSILIKDSNISTKVVDKKIIAQKEAIKEKITEKDFKRETLSLYEKKIKFIKMQILMRNSLGFSGGSIAIKNAKNYISFNENNSAQYLSQKMEDLDIEYVSFLKNLITERQKIITYQNEIILNEKQILQKLEKEKSEISEKNFISETEYQLRSNNLNSLIDEKNFEKEYSEQDKNVNDMISYHNETDEKYNRLLIVIAEKDIAGSQKESADLIARIEASKADAARYRSLADTLKAQREQLQIQPTSIKCETNYSKGIGYPSTYCTEFPTMRTMICDTNYNVTGNSVKNCYFK